MMRRAAGELQMGVALWGFIAWSAGGRRSGEPARAQPTSLPGCARRLPCRGQTPAQ